VKGRSISSSRDWPRLQSVEKLFAFEGDILAASVVLLIGRFLQTEPYSPSSEPPHPHKFAQNRHTLEDGLCYSICIVQ
jgi:hypothetical protein